MYDYFYTLFFFSRKLSKANDVRVWTSIMYYLFNYYRLLCLLQSKCFIRVCTVFIKFLTDTDFQFFSLVYMKIYSYKLFILFMNMLLFAAPACATAGEYLTEIESIFFTWVTLSVVEVVRVTAWGFRGL